MVRWLATFYLTSAALTLCWVYSTFGYPALVVGCLMVLPGLLVLWRLRKEPIGVRQRVDFAIAGTVAVGAISFLIFRSYDLGLDRHAKFEREYHSFLRKIANEPEYGAIDVSYTHRKGGRVYIKGTVATKALHDRLIEVFESTVHSNESGYYDGIVYPGHSVQP